MLSISCCDILPFLYLFSWHNGHSRRMLPHGCSPRRWASTKSCSCAARTWVAGSGPSGWVRIWRLKIIMPPYLRHEFLEGSELLDRRGGVRDQLLEICHVDRQVILLADLDGCVGFQPQMTLGTAHRVIPVLVDAVQLASPREHRDEQSRSPDVTQQLL